MIKWLMHRSSDPVVVTERVKMAAGCFNLIAIGIFVGSALAPLFNPALPVPTLKHIAAVLAFLLLEGFAMFLFRFLPEAPKQENR